MYYKDCINNDPGLNLTHFMAMSNLVKIDNHYYYFIFYFFWGGEGGTVAAKIALPFYRQGQIREAMDRWP